MLTTTIAAAVLATIAHAHNSPHHPAMFGFDYPKQSEWPYGGESGSNPPGCFWNSERAKWPIRADQNRPESFWLSNGLRDYPPPEGVFLEIESGGTLTLDLNENRAFSRMRWPESKNPNAKYAGQAEGTLHTVNNFDEPADISKFGGTALAIAYTSDEHAVRGADFTVISTNWASPWLALATYPMPSGLPPCPPGGCLCTWNWLHTAGNTRRNPNPPDRPEGEGYGDELYNVLFRCTVTGATDANNVVPKGAVPKQCDGEGETGGDRGNCTTGPKTPIIAWMADGNNVFPPEDVHQRAKWRKPSYTWRYGFSDGAQQDAVVPKGQEASANGVGSVSDQPRANLFEPGKGGLAIVNARGEALWPGVLHADVVAELKRNGHAIGTANATAEGSVETKPADGVDSVQSNVAVGGANSNSTAPGLGKVHLAGEDVGASSASASTGSAAAAHSSAAPASSSGPAGPLITPPAGSNATIPDSGAKSTTPNGNGATPDANTTPSTIPSGSGTVPKPSGKAKCLRRRKRRMAHH